MFTPKKFLGLKNLRKIQDNFFKKFKKERKFWTLKNF